MYQYTWRVFPFSLDSIIARSDEEASDTKLAKIQYGHSHNKLLQEDSAIDAEHFLAKHGDYVRLVAVCSPVNVKQRIVRDSLVRQVARTAEASLDKVEKVFVVLCLASLPLCRVVTMIVVDQRSPNVKPRDGVGIPIAHKDLGVLAQT